MLKCVLISRPSEFSTFLADWLAKRTNLQAVVAADAGRNTWRWRSRWLVRSWKRYGLISLVDRVLFRAWCLRSAEINQGWYAMIEDIRRACPLAAAQPAVRLTTASVNAPEIAQLLARLQPDILFINCIAERVLPRIYDVPKLGTFIYHEGITPEYRGVHSVYYRALANGDDDKVGYTLLKANPDFDAGPVYAQARNDSDRSAGQSDGLRWPLGAL